MPSPNSPRKLALRACLLLACTAVPLARADAQSQRGGHAQSARQSTPPAGAATRAAAVPDETTRRIDAFGALVVTAFEANDLSSLVARVANESLIETVLASAPVPAAMRQQLAVGMLQGFNSRGGLLGSVLARGDGDTILYRGAGIREGRPVARFRILPVDGGFRYFDVSFLPGSGDLIAVDFWTNGEWLTETLAATLLGIVPSLEPLPASATPQERATRRIAVAASSIMARIRARDYEGAVSTFDALPPDVRSSRLVMRMMLAVHLPDDESHANRFMDSYAAAFPDDPLSASLDIDRCFNLSDFDGEVRAIERMIRLLGEDAYLRVLLASAFQLGGRLDAALVAITRAVELEPALVEAHTSRAEIAARLRRFELVTESVEALDALGLEPAGLHEDAVFAEYRATADYRRLFP